MSNRLVDSRGEVAAFVAGAEALHEWIRDRLYLCGGWANDLERQYAPRLFGYYRFDAAGSAEMQRVALGLGRLYSHIGAQIGNLVRDGVPPDWPLDAFSVQETNILGWFRGEDNWATTLRADVVLDTSGLPKIVEVNSDNVGGLEDLVMMLGYFAGAAEAEMSVPASKALAHLQQCYVRWLRSQYAAFRTRRGLPPKALEDSTVALAADDLENSTALTRILAALLRSNKINAVPCRPSHLSRDARGLVVTDELGGCHHSVDIVFRHMLWHELFEEPSGLANPPPKPDAISMLEAARDGEVLLLNPPTERLLFSKAILAELCTRKHGLFDLDMEDRQFVDHYVAPTEYLDVARRVLKPSSLYGGQGVLMSGGLTTGNRQGSTWVAQSRVDGEHLRTLYRANRNESPTMRNLFVVHGLLLYGSPASPHELAGIMTRIGPDPVVNFSRGAQIVAGVMDGP